MAIMNLTHRHPRYAWPRRIGGIAVATAATAAIWGLAAGAPGSAAIVPRTVLTGVVRTGARPLADARAVLSVAGSGAPRHLGVTWTAVNGAFRITYTPPRSVGPLYVTATGTGGAARAPVQLMTVAGTVTQPVRSVTVNEVTTVGSVYALAQFMHDDAVRGVSPGLENAAATAGNLIDPVTGGDSGVVARPPNGSDTRTLATLSSLADIVGGCTQGSVATCARLFAVARPVAGVRPTSTLQAVLDIARNPMHNAARLKVAPTAWVLSLVYTAGGFNGPGRMAFDSTGSVWVTNNFAPGTDTDPGLGVISLSPTGVPINGSPVTGGGVKGAWWGIAVDQHNHIWVSNYVGDDTTSFLSPDFTGGTTVAEFTDHGSPLSPSTGFDEGDISAPQGVAVDTKGDVWIANHVGNSVTEYPRGNPHAARVYTGEGLEKPFAVVVGKGGTIWVDDEAISHGVDGGVTRITPGGSVLAPLHGGGMNSPQGMAVDQLGNLWIANLASNGVTEIRADGTVDPDEITGKSLVGPWSVVVDANGNIWVASFLGETLTELCGAERIDCPRGAKTGSVISPPARGFSNGGLEHVTAVQVDGSGNVWVANNWSRIVPKILGGNGLVEFVGLAAPVRTPLIGLPQRP